MSKVKEPVTINHANASLCLHLAEELLELLRVEGLKAMEGDSELAVVSQDQVFEIVNRRFSTPLVDRRIRAVGLAIAESINAFGVSSCTVWKLAHLLDHSLFDEDLDDLPE